MLSRILIILTTLLIGCQSRENDLDLAGGWIDVSCIDNLENCESRYPIIYIKPQIRDSIFVKYSNGELKSVWAYKMSKAVSLKLENKYESLLFPNFETQKLQYYDNTSQQFVYYTKLPNE